MAILTSYPSPPRAFNQVANYASSVLVLKLLSIIRSSERGRTSEALRKALTASSLGRGRAVARVPHYWAPFYHDGRGPAPRKSRPGRWMVWFKDPGDDPRWGPGLPVLRSEVRKLTREEFQAGLEENRRRGPGNPFMIVAKVSPFPPKTRAKSNPFFERGLNRLVVEAVEVDGIVADAIGDILDRKLRTSAAKPFIRQRAKLNLRV